MEVPFVAAVFDTAIYLCMLRIFYVAALRDRGNGFFEVGDKVRASARATRGRRARTRSCPSAAGAR